MSKKESKINKNYIIKKYRPIISKDDKAILREKEEGNPSKLPIISDHHIDAA